MRLLMVVDPLATLDPQVDASVGLAGAAIDLGHEVWAGAWAADGVIEAVEPTDPSAAALGVQWHPELTGTPFRDPTGPAIFGWLVSWARHRTEVRGGPVAAGRG